MIAGSTRGKKNAIWKLVIVLALAVMMFSIVASFAAADLSDTWDGIKDKFSGLGDTFSGLGDTAGGFAGSKWVVIIVNAAILWIIGYVVTSIMFKDLKEQKVAIILGVIGVALLIAYQIYQANITEFLWKIPEVRDFMYPRVIVNLVVVVSLLYILYFVLELKPKELNSKPFDVIVFVVILLIAFNAVKPVPSYNKETYHYIWEWESIVPYRFFLLGDSGCTYYQYETDQYYQEEDKWYRDALWGGDEGWFGDDLITEPKIVEELDKAKEVRERIKDVVDRNELTNSDERSFYDATKGWPEGRVTIKSKVDRYCYTAASIQELLDQKSKDEPYKPTEKEPSTEEITNTGGFGILRGSHLIMLILTMIVLSWVAGVWKWFEGSTKLPYVLSFIVAAMIAHSGIGMQQFAWLIQMLIILGLFKAFGGDFDKFFGKEKKFSTWVFAILSVMIVVSVTEMVKPGYGLPLLKYLTFGNIYGLFESPMHLIVGILQVVLAGAVLFAPWKKRFKIPIIIFLLFGIKFIPGFGQYGLNGTKATVISLVMLVIGFIAMIWLTTQDERAKMILGRGWGYMKNRFWEFLNESGIAGRLGMRRLTESDMPGEMPWYITVNLPLFYYLFNLCKRTWIYYQYWNVVRGLITGKPSMIETVYKGMKRHYNLKTLKRQVMDYRSAPTNFETKYIYSGVKTSKSDDEDDEEYVLREPAALGGWCSHHQKIAKVYNETVELSMYAKAAFSINDMDGFNHYLTLLQSKKKQFDDLQGDISKRYKGYKERLEAFGSHNKLKSMMMTAFLMANSSGFYDHTYVFAKPGAPIITKDENGKIVPGEPKVPEKHEKGQGMYYEVDLDGKFIDDKNDNVAEWESVNQVYEGDFESYREKNKPKPIRQLVDPRDVLTYEDHLQGNDANDILNFMNAEWELWLKDMQYGRYHQRSRSAFDYIKAYSSKPPVYHDNHIFPEEGTIVYDQNPSFDLRILTNPGKFNYWGRRYYRHMGENFGYPDNPIPWISLLGITMYLKYEFETLMEEAAHAKEWAQKFPAAGNLTDENTLISSLSDHFQ